MIPCVLLSIMAWCCLMSINNELILSPLPKTWIFDLDGTIVVHNGVYSEEGDRLLPGVKEFFDKINRDDYILILTARPLSKKGETVNFLQKEGIKFSNIIFDIPTGERILLNDEKESGLKTALHINLKRNQGLGNISFKIDMTR